MKSLNVYVCHNKEFITVTELACQCLNPSKAEYLRAEVARILKQPRRTNKNQTKDEFKAMKELKSDREHIVLTADKGVALVVMDKNEYIKKMKELWMILTHTGL